MSGGKFGNEKFDCGVEEWKEKGGKRMKIFTHTGILRGSDARTPKGLKINSLFRETSNYWVASSGNKYRKRGWSGSGIGDWPMYTLEIDSLKKLETPVKK